MKDGIGTFVFAEIIDCFNVDFLLQKQSSAIEHYKKDDANQFNPSEDVKDGFRGSFSELEYQEECLSDENYSVERHCCEK